MPLPFSCSTSSFDINTDVKNGKVTLTGKVESDVDKALAAELIANLEGVESVENKLTVLNNDTISDKDIMQTLKDTKVETVVKTRLLFESEVRGTDIEVEVDRGIVTLTGTVKSKEAKDLAGAIAKGATDVTKVVNELKILPS